MSDTPAGKPAEVLIVGGGIAGLTLAIALGRRGRRADIVELRRDATPTGWGLLLTGPTLRALRPLELAEACVAAGYGFDQITDCTIDGTVIHVVDPPSLNPGLSGFVGIFRPALYRILSEQARSLGTDVRLGTTVQELAQDSDGVEVAFSDGGSQRYQLVVGADGVGSHVRQLIGVETRPRYTEQLVWRALVPRPDWVTGLHTFAGAPHLTGITPISRDDAYVFVTENTPERAKLSDEVLVETLRDHLAPLTGGMAEVRAQIRDPATIVRRPIEVIIEPLPWHRGRVLLVGDAAHAPSPQLVSGAAMAVEDAVLLAEMLDEADGIEQTLRRFGERRYERCRVVVEGSAEMGVLQRAGRFADAQALQNRCFGVLAQPI